MLFQAGNRRRIVASIVTALVLRPGAVPCPIGGFVLSMHAGQCSHTTRLRITLVHGPYHAGIERL